MGTVKTMGTQTRYVLKVEDEYVVVAETATEVIDPNDVESYDLEPDAHFIIEREDGELGLTTDKDLARDNAIRHGIDVDVRKTVFMTSSDINNARVFTKRSDIYQDFWYFNAVLDNKGQLVEVEEIVTVREVS